MAIHCFRNSAVDAPWRLTFLVIGKGHVCTVDVGKGTLNAGMPCLPISIAGTMFTDKVFSQMLGIPGD